MTYWSRNSFSSTGLSISRVREAPSIPPPSAPSPLLKIRLQRLMHSLQMYTLDPAMIRCTSFCPLPQKEQWGPRRLPSLLSPSYLNMPDLPKFLKKAPLGLRTVSPGKTDDDANLRGAHEVTEKGRPQATPDETGPHQRLILLQSSKKDKRRSPRASPFVSRTPFSLPPVYHSVHHAIPNRFLRRHEEVSVGIGGDAL